MKKIFIFAFAALLAACSTVTLHNSEKASPIYPTQTINNQFFIAGIGQEKIIDVAEICDGRGFVVKTKYTFIDGLAATLTGGIYSPSTTEIYCDKLK